MNIIITILNLYASGLSILHIKLSLPEVMSYDKSSLFDYQKRYVKCNDGPANSVTPDRPALSGLHHLIRLNCLNISHKYG